MQPRSQNFPFLLALSPQLEKIAGFAESYLAEDPNGSLTKTRQWAEVLAKRIAAKVGAPLPQPENQLSLLGKLEAIGAISGEVARLFHAIRKAGNAAAHSLAGSQEEAETSLRMAHTLAIWFMTAYGGQPTFKAPSFQTPTKVKPRASTDEAELQAALAQALAELEALKAEAAQRAESETAALIASATEQAKKVELSEKETRKLIDQMLADAGWTVSTTELTYKKGARPAKGQNMAIAEWPCGKDRADYILFAGLIPVGVVEAKRQAKNVMSALEQAERYSRQFEITAEMAAPGGPWGANRLPYLFSTNGRSYIKQLEVASGIWFRDVRSELGTSAALPAFHRPEDLLALLKQDLEAAQQKLGAEPLAYLNLRPYQNEAIKAVETALGQNQRQIMLAMATGTGKTRTALGLIYRLLKANRFRRILFIVDREALGEQTLSSFQSNHLQGNLALTEIYDVKGIADGRPEEATRLDIATVQSLTRWVLDEEHPPAIGLYDCIIVDECHRGYTLDRLMNDEELEYREELAYQSRYRRVLEHFDAVKVGLTATPALHTKQIFGDPVHQYTYRQAVIDGYLVDHGPPVQVTTRLAQEGIHWQLGEEVPVYDTRTGQINLFNLPDEVDLEIDAFNRHVLTKGFNEAVCKELSESFDLLSEVGKTLIFCVSDTHADMVVEALQRRYTDLDVPQTDKLIRKITGSVDDPSLEIRRFKNEAEPKIVVTVDLLTTGIDVPQITNLVFLRRVRSRILYEQMLGRATRLCDEIGKESFRIFDFVRLYEALEPVNSMKPVVQNPTISFGQLASELQGEGNAEFKRQVFDQFSAKLQRRATKLAAHETFTLVAGMDAKELAALVKRWSPEALATYLQQHPAVVQFLDEVKVGDPRRPYISEEADEVLSVKRGYGKAQRPEDYLEEFGAWVKSHINEIPALQVVCQRPRDLTRADLKEIKKHLAEAGFADAFLDDAYKQTNQAIAANVIAYIRQRALGSPLESHAVRVEKGLQRILTSRAWTDGQRTWLRHLADQIRENVVLDVAALDEGAFKLKGGAKRIDSIFGGQSANVLGDLQEAIWLDVV